MKLNYHPAAKAELTAAVQFFADVAPEFGKKFLLEAEHCLGLVREFPGQNRILEPDIRIMTLPRFPYVIYYHPLIQSIHILAFKKQALHPDHWRYRRPAKKDEANHPA